jgi:hypothetical protein
MTWFLTFILNWLWGKLLAFLTLTTQKIIRKEEIKKEAEESVKPLEDAETADEIDKGADSALDNF